MHWEEDQGLTGSSVPQTSPLWGCQSGFDPAWGSEGSEGPADVEKTVLSDESNVIIEHHVAYSSPNPLPGTPEVEGWWYGCRRDWEASVALHRRKPGGGWTWWHFAPGWLTQSLGLIGEYWPAGPWYHSHLYHQRGSWLVDAIMSYNPHVFLYVRQMIVFEHCSEDTHQVWGSKHQWADWRGNLEAPSCDSWPLISLYQASWSICRDQDSSPQSVPPKGSPTSTTPSTASPCLQKGKCRVTGKETETALVWNN